MGALMQILPRDFRYTVWIIILNLIAVSAPVSAGASKSAPTEMRIGTVSKFTDKNSPAAIIARVTSAYSARVNAAGGLNGRSIRLISYDHEGDRKKALDLTRRLFEVDHVALLFQVDGKMSDAIMPYVRFKQIPQIYDAVAISDTGVKTAPTSLQAKMLGEYIRQMKPDSRIAILYEEGNSAVALDAFYAGLGMENARAMVTNMLGSAEYNGNRVARVSGASADFLAIFGGEAFQRETIKQMAGLKWHPTPVITDPAKIVMPVGTIIATNHRAPIKLTAEEAADWEQFKSSLDDASSDFAIEGYLLSRSLINILQRCEDELSSACLKQTYASYEEKRLKRTYVGSAVRFDGYSWNDSSFSESER
jgi:branched-chain amino acid transport system substrate-binding protein